MFLSALAVQYLSDAGLLQNLKAHAGALVVATEAVNFADREISAGIAADQIRTGIDHIRDVLSRAIASKKARIGPSRRSREDIEHDGDGNVSRGNRANGPVMSVLRDTAGIDAFICDDRGMNKYGQVTRASKGQQAAWLALFDDKDAHCPTGYRLKDWLFGSSAVDAAHALFDVETAGLAITGDLFGDERLITDADAFWTQQMTEVEARKAAYIADGWSDVILLDKGVRFQSWNHSVASKRKGGRVYVEVHATGEVEFHEGYITDREAAARARGEKAETQPKVQRPEVTSAMNTYIDLHRHAAVRAELARHGSVALRALAAHVIASADHFRIDLQSYVCPKDEVQESVETCASEVVFAERRRAVLAMLGLNPESLTVTGKSYGNARQFAPIFARLLELPDPAVLEVVAIVMGETLAAGSEAVEMIGQHLEVDPAKVWQADGAFWGLVRDKEVLGKIVAEVAGSEVAAANAGEKAKVLKAIVADHLEGSNGRAKVEAWVPKWLAFPPAPYTPRGGVGSVAANERMLHILARAAETQADAGDADPDDADNEDADIDDEKNVGEDGEHRDRRNIVLERRFIAVAAFAGLELEREAGDRALRYEAAPDDMVVAPVRRGEFGAAIGAAHARQGHRLIGIELLQRQGGVGCAHLHLLGRAGR